jgi:hypothetical protein
MIMQGGTSLSRRNPLNPQALHWFPLFYRRRTKHPQLFVEPRLKCAPKATMIAPQSKAQRNNARL